MRQNYNYKSAATYTPPSSYGYLQISFLIFYLFSSNRKNPIYMATIIFLTIVIIIVTV